MTRISEKYPQWHPPQLHPAMTRRMIGLPLNPLGPCWHESLYIVCIVYGSSPKPQWSSSMNLPPLLYAAVPPSTAVVRHSLVVSERLKRPRPIRRASCTARYCRWCRDIPRKTGRCTFLRDFVTFNSEYRNHFVLNVLLKCAGMKAFSISRIGIYCSLSYLIPGTWG